MLVDASWNDFCRYSSYPSEGAIPLYTHPVKELDEQFKKGFEAGKEEGWKAHKFHHPVKELTDEEINIIAILQDAEIVPVGHEIWKTDEEFNKYKKIVLTTAKALRKAQEK
jgi:hypothetical protein